MVLADNLPLPDECIDLIIAYHVNNLQTLFALLLTCRRFFHLTAPVLFRSPFRLIEHSRRWSTEEKEKRTTDLLALLVCSATTSAAADFPSLSIIVRKQSQSSSSQHPITLDYLRFYIDQFNVDICRLLDNLRSGNTIGNQFILDESRSMTELQHEVSASMIGYQPENIKVIGLPFIRSSQILVPQISNLRSLVRLELSDIPSYCVLESIIEFIRVHDARHNTLREIKIKGGEDVNRHPIRAHWQLVRLVQAMRTPQVVDARNWREAIQVLHKIPHESLRALLLGMADMPPSNVSVSEYLEHCVCLEELRMPILDARLFSWAPKARSAIENENGRYTSRPRLHRSPSSFSQLATSLASMITSNPWHTRHHSHSDWTEHEQSQGIARIKSLDLRGEDTNLIPVLQDAVDAFRDSLEVLKAQSLAAMSILDSVQYFGQLTWSWRLSQLSVLDLEGEVAASFDFQALRFCPRLVTLRLALPPYMYSSTEDADKLDEMVERMPKICYATRLLDLELRGKWPISDDHLRLIARHMRRLTNIYIVSGTDPKYTLNGIQVLVQSLEKLESLSISKWFTHAMRWRLESIKAINPRLEIIEVEEK